MFPSCVICVPSNRGCVLRLMKTLSDVASICLAFLRYVKAFVLRRSDCPSLRLDGKHTSGMLGIHALDWEVIIHMSWQLQRARLLAERISWLAGWLAGWLVGWLAGWWLLVVGCCWLLVGWLAGWLVGWLAGC